MKVKNKHGGIGSRWVTVPNHFPNPEDLTYDDWFQLIEGYGVGSFETKTSGKHYMKVRTKDGDDVDALIRYLGYDKWHEKWERRRGWFGNFFIGSWKRKKLCWMD